MKKHFMGALLPVAAIFLAPVSAYSQNVSATLTGLVSDSSGALLPDTLVELSNPSTGLSLQTKANSAGSYRFVDVAPGPNYTLTFSRGGFSLSSSKGFIWM